jgi:hypothetical protein
MSKKKPSTNLGIFNQERYHNITLNDRAKTAVGHMSPATTDGLANHAEAVISFFHVPSESDVFFKAFITTFVESYQSDWNNETVFGRTDPIYTFKNTQRHITLGWKIPADTMGEAYHNLAKVQKLAQFLYPNYADLGASGAVLSQSPLVRLKVMNLAAKSPPTDMYENVDSTGQSAASLFKSYKSTNNPSQGILGVISNVNINHNLENPEIGVIQPDGKQNLVLPKMIEVSIDFACIHESTLGWTEGNNFITPSFPYNAYAEDEFDGVLDFPTYNQKIAARQAAERKRVQAEQDRTNAEARGYDGMFGKGRLKKDIRQMSKIEARNARRATKGKDPRAGDVANYEYFDSAIRGANILASEDAEYADALDAI